VVSHFIDPSAWVIAADEPATWLSGRPRELDGLNGMERMMALDTLSYLPDDILVKVDRAAMAISLETRVPFLDHRLVEFAWKLPFDFKLRHGGAKWALRQVLYRHVPRELVDRPKQGFSVPLCEWLRGSLREWAESLLDASRLRREGFFHPAPIRQLWSAHLSGKHDGSARLWNVLMFQAWLSVQRA
jgi:asparagine synthase (glutamine-hydrolysing)